MATRRTFLKSTGLTAASLLRVPWGRAADAKPPNVLFIAVDDLNDWIGCLGGHPQARTPNMDRLAQRGMLFTRAQCAAPVCGPSRAAVFTGIAPYRTGIFTNDDKFANIKDSVELLPQYFARHGYRTLGAGKLMHGGQKAAPEAFHEFGPGYNKWSPFTPEEIKITQEELAAGGPYVKHTVDRGRGKLRAVLPRNKMPRDRNRGSSTIESFDWGPFDIPDEAMSDTIMANWGIEQLEREHDKPFFLGLGFYRPHQPLFMPRDYYDLYPPHQVILPETPEDDLDDLGQTARDFGRRALTSGRHDTVLENGQWRNAVSSYLACVTYVDAQIGRVLDALDASPHAQNTIIVLWGDHGWHLGEKEHWGKFTGWNRATRVPLIIVPAGPRVPRGFYPGKSCAKPVNLLDLFPTLADLAGLEAKDGLDGKSLRPLLNDPAQRWRAATVTAFGRGNNSICTEEWRYIRYYDGSEELYNDQSDPNEWRNLAALPEYAEIKEKMARYLPEQKDVAHFVRMGEWKAVLRKDGEGDELFHLPSENYVAEKNNVAKEHPEVLARMRGYIKEHGITAQHFAIPES